MPRPPKSRRICAMPGAMCFAPKGSCIQQPACIIMTLDEYETIRLIDFNGRTQEEAAVSMDVARTTVQSIYESARKKLAQALCLGMELHIEGGNYFLCEGRGRGCRCPRCRKEDMKMKLAVTYENGQVYQHFGHTEAFKIYEIADNAVAGSQVIGTGGSGHGALAGFLQEQGVCALICGGIGGGAINALQQAGIEVYAGISGDADQAVSSYLAGTLAFSTEASCSHHGHDHEGGHSCGNHGHGSEGGHSCGGGSCGK